MSYSLSFLGVGFNVIFDGTDFNSLTTPGIYYYGTLMYKPNCPPHKESDAGALFVIPTNNPNYQMQIAISLESQIKISARLYIPGSWNTV